jgi:hypothetical protein
MKRHDITSAGEYENMTHLKANSVFWDFVRESIRVTNRVRYE